LDLLRTRARLTGKSTAWGVAWVSFLWGDWAQAEAFLRRASRWRPEEPTLRCLLALCQARRGKRQSAILNARLACTPAPRNKEYAKVLIDRLLDGGFLREAQEWLRSVEAEISEDPEQIFSLIRMDLLRRDYAEAGEWTEYLRQKAPELRTLVGLGSVYEQARQEEKAAAFYRQAFEVGHCPEALVGLARLEAQRGNSQQARDHLLAALDVNRPLGDGAGGPRQLFPLILTQLVALEAPAANCQSWTATLPMSVSLLALASASLLVYAPAWSDAQRYLEEVLSAMRPGTPPIHPKSIHWRLAAKERQPDRPVRPGVQTVLGYGAIH